MFLAFGDELSARIEDWQSMRIRFARVLEEVSGLGIFLLRSIVVWEGMARGGVEVRT